MSQITKPITQLLKGKNFAYLSTLMKDGSPQVTPTWIDIDKDGNSILVNTAEGRIKHKNVSRDPRVAISISDQNNPYNMVSIRADTDRLAKKYLGIDKYPLSFPQMKKSHFKNKSRKSISSTTTQIVFE
jgi:PPOX class probable F420-dependent enzyme